MPPGSDRNFDFLAENQSRGLTPDFGFRGATP
jgi:hypothetical protein